MLDFADDYVTWDNTEGIIYESARKPPPPRVQLDGGTMIAVPDANPNAADAVPVAKRRALNRRELAASNGAYTSQDLVWIVPAAVLVPGFQAKPADVVVDGDGVRWTVLETTLGRGRATWRLTCRNPIVAYDLQDLVTIEQAASSFDAAGVLVRTWAPLYTRLACRVQPMTQEAKDERGIRGNQTAYTLYLSRQVVVDVRECRVSWPADGPSPTAPRLLDLVAVRNAERIDQLPELDAVLKP